MCVCIMTPKSDVHIEVRWSVLKCDGLQFVLCCLNTFGYIATSFLKVLLSSKSTTKNEQ